MGSKSKRTKRVVDFSSAIRTLSDLQDQKHLQYTQNFTQALSTLKVRLEVLEDLLIEKLGETEDSLKERVLVTVAKSQGLMETDGDVVLGSPIRVKVKEQIVGKESEQNEWHDAFMIMGQNQVNAAVDTLLIGAKLGETRDVTLPDPQDSNVQRRITVTVLKIFKGQETASDTNSEATQQKAASGS